MVSDAKDILSAAEIETIHKLLTIRATMSADEFVDYVSALRHSAKALLRHIATLSAPLPEDGGEALGREAWIGRADVDKWGMPPERVVERMRASFDDQPEEEQARYRRIGLRCHAIGYAAGALSREGEIARWRGAFEGATPEEAVGALRDKGEEYRREIARLTAELAVTRADGARMERDVAVSALEAEIGGCVTPGTDYERGLLMAIKIIRAGNTEGDKAREEQDRRREEKRIARAKEDGARVERERIVERVRRWAAEGAEGMPEAGDETVVDWIASEIERGDVDTSARGDR